MASIIFKNITKTYPGNITVVHDFNLEVEDKEFIVLVGPSGCGKSTTLRMIAGLEDITNGELYIGSRLVNNLAPKDRDIAMVFQNYALYPHMNVFQNMAFALKLQRVPKEEINKKVKEAATILGIEELIQRKPGQLSGGERQRVALGRAMVRDPAVFLLDEPLSNLDAKLRTSTRTEISNLHKRLGTTFIYVTHDQVEAMTMGDRIVVMKDGIIQQVDTPTNLYNNPINKFVAGFIGMPQMNFIDAVIESCNMNYMAKFGDVIVPIRWSRLSKKAQNRYLNKEVILGIRPENLHIIKALPKNSAAAIITARVDLVEMMGAEIYIYASYQYGSIIARASQEKRPKIGEILNFAIDTNKIHLFDKETNMVFEKHFL